MTRINLIKAIQEKGWNNETKQYAREVFVNEPTNRFSYYDLNRAFNDKCTVEEIISIIPILPHFTKDNKFIRGTSNVVLCKNKEMNRLFYDEEELVEFWCGTSKTRALAFLDRGDGYTALECPVVLHNGSITNYGIQVMLSDSRAYDYACSQAGATRDKPYVIHGFIKAKYLYPANNGYEYAIPCEYYNHIQIV